MISSFNADAEKEAAAAVPPSEAGLAANVTSAVNNATSHAFERFFETAARSSSLVTCARIYSLNWCAECLGEWALVGG